MKLDLHCIGSNLQEVFVDETKSGTLDKKESVEFVVDSLYVLHDMLSNVNMDVAAEAVYNITKVVQLEELTNE